jgi:hypothetical protein
VLAYAQVLLPFSCQADSNAGKLLQCTPEMTRVFPATLVDCLARFATALWWKRTQVLPQPNALFPASFEIRWTQSAAPPQSLPVSANNSQQGPLRVMVVMKQVACSLGLYHGSNKFNPIDFF